MSDKIENIENLLKEIKKENQEKQRTAEDFNIFEILGVAHLEVSTHSAFIANLLNPKGSHSRGAKFLKEFLKLIDVDVDVEGFNLSSAQVEVEKHIGDLGRIDIFITDNTNWAIAIENKIYAGLQEKQLGRYMEFLNNSKMPKKKLVYLTLQKDDDKELLENQGVHKDDRYKYHHITYEKEIKEWLNPFTQPEDILFPIKISTTILQYISTIKGLIKMSNDEKFYKIIDKNYEAYKKIISLDYRRERIRRLLSELTNNFLGEKKFTENFNNGGREAGINIILNGNPKQALSIIFEETNYKKLYIGIYAEDLKEDVKEKLKKELNNNGWELGNPWVAWKYWNEINSDVIETLCLDDSNAKRNKQDLIKELKVLETAWMEINKPSAS